MGNILQRLPIGNKVNMKRLLKRFPGQTEVFLRIVKAFEFI